MRGERCRALQAPGEQLRVSPCHRGPDVRDEQLPRVRRGRLAPSPKHTCVSRSSSSDVADGAVNVCAAHVEGTHQAPRTGASKRCILLIGLVALAPPSSEPAFTRRSSPNALLRFSRWSMLSRRAIPSRVPPGSTSCVLWPISITTPGTSKEVRILAGPSCARSRPLAGWLSGGMR